MEALRDTLQPVIRSVLQPVLAGGEMSMAPKLPTAGLLAWIVDGVDTIGLSITDYADVDASVRSIFFVDSETLVATATAEAAALASELINTGTMIGTEDMGVTLYSSDTDLAILHRAYRYFGQPWPYPEDTDYIIDGSDILVDGADNLADAEVS